MKKILMICTITAAAVLVNGCVVFSFEESGHTKRVCAVCAPSQEVIRVVHVPCPPSRPQHRHFLE